MVNDERVQRYRDALQSDYCGCGACERQLAAVMAVADAEQAELRDALHLAMSALIRSQQADVAVARALDLPLPDDESLWPDYLADGLFDTANARMRALADERAKVARVEALVGDWQANGNSRELGDPTAETWQNCARQLLDALAGDAAKPCGGRNSNVCVAEGCFGEACIKGRA